MSLRDKKKRQTAARILDAAQSLFLRQGFGQTTMDEIAGAAGVSRAGLFNYYNGKGLILDSLAARLEPRLVQMVRHYMNRPLTTAQQITALFAYVAQVIDQTAELTRLLIIQAGSSAELTDLRSAFVELVEQGQQRGEVRDDFSADTMAEALYLAFVAGLLGWARSADTPLAELFSQRARFLCANLLV